jgi:hypothetical protein
MSTNKPGDPQKVDPFAPRPRIEMSQLPLASLQRWFLGQLEIEKSQVPVQSIPIFGVERGSLSIQIRNAGNFTLANATSWTPLSPSVKGNIAVSGLRDLDIRIGGTAVVGGSGTGYTFSVLIDQVEFQRFVLGQSPNAGNGLVYFEGTTASSWRGHGVVPASLLDRKVYSIELVYRRTGGANNGLLYWDNNNTVSLYALEQ